MEVYKPRRTIGGHLGRSVYNNVLKVAKGFARSKLANDLGVESKKQILDVGTKAINKMLSGEAPVGDSIKEAATTLRRKLPSILKRKFKRSVLG